ncbi:MAG: hypothetical protein KGJ84_05105 [Elusimicrobia bacterium]|nr:hypothetical protein [Elusimicrobiota bacterium]
MDQPKIPTLKDSQKPQVKIRGLEAGATLFDRLKQFKKKDLAFILAGLGTLFMAPLAEHFMMSPESGDSALNAGFGGKGGSRGIFSDSGSVSPYETGVNGQAPGSAIGGGADVITPLNVRDPSALVMGPGATQQPPTNSVAPSVTPPTAPVTHSESDLKDALSAGARGVGAAAHAAKALLPVPKVSLNTSGLRGLGAVSGGSTATGGPITSAGLVTGKANAGGGGLNNVRAMPGYKGAGTRGQSSGGSGLAALKAAGDKAGDLMNHGSAATALDAAAAQQIPTGGSGNGGAGEGGMAGGDKAAGGNQDKSSKSVGESLEFLKQKAMQEAQIALWSKEQEAGDNKLEMLKMRNSMAEAIAGKLGGALGDTISCPFTKGFKKCMTAASDPGSWFCSSLGPNTISGAAVGKCGDDGVQWQVGGTPGTLIGCTGTVKDGSPSTPDTNKQATGCTALDGASSASASPAPPKKDGPSAVNTAGGPTSGPAASIVAAPAADLGAACIALTAEKNNLVSNLGANTAGTTAGDTAAAIDRVLGKAAQVVALRDALANGPSKDCSSAGVSGVTKPVAALQNTAITTLTGAVPGVKNSVMSNKKDADPYTSAKSASDDGLQAILDAGAALALVDGEVKKDALTPATFKPTSSELKAIQATYRSDSGKDTTSVNFDKIAKSYDDVVTAYKNAGDVQALLQAKQKSDGASDVYSAVVKVMGDTKNGSGPKEGSVVGVITENGQFKSFSDALRNKDTNPNVAAAQFTLNSPDPKALDNSKPGKDSATADATTTAKTSIDTATAKLKEYEAAPDVAPDKTKQTEIQTNYLDGDKGVTKAHTKMWQAAGGDIGVINTALSAAQTKLTGKK